MSSFDEASLPVVPYRQKYRNLKRKFKFLLYENECYKEQLRKAQRKLVKVTRENIFLLERILKLMSSDSSSTDSDAALSSDSDSEVRVEPSPPRAAVKRKKPSATSHETRNVHHQRVASSSATAGPRAGPSRSVPTKTAIAPGPLPGTSATASVLMCSGPSLNPTAEKKVARGSKRAPATVSAPAQPVPPLAAGVPSRIVQLAAALSVGHFDGHMTSEEVERLLEAWQPRCDLHPEKVPLTVPAELFSNELPADL